MKRIPLITATIAAAAFAGSASAQCTEEDGYVFVFSQCQQQPAESEDKADLCHHEPGEDPAFMLFLSNVILDSAENRSSLGSLFYYVIEEQHGVGLQGSSSQCFETEDAAKAHRATTIERYRDGFENVVVKDVTFEKGAGAPETVAD
ncbi:hypothetical protein [Henriciella aquimarina]|uniref:hypothetical protein n=1 Tax=Henriciella aquimarina TaxID=545261 RepID=UPI0009FDA94B|nr:hypothetical protein [Henriciella aquimarina]